MLALLLAAAPVAGQMPAQPAVPAGVVETGAPAAVVFATEAIGLSAAPTDLHRLPDGRILVVARHELAIGDGVRWEVYRQPETATRVDTTTVAIDADGEIYAGIAGAFGRVVLGPDSTWSIRPQSAAPRNSRDEQSVGTIATAIGRDWFWHSGSGALVTWNPGQPARLVGELNAIERIFACGDATFASEQTTGAVFRITDTLEPVIPAGATTATSTITCAAPYDEREALVGTNAGGIQRFDGAALRPFPAGSALAGIHRINDLCAASPGFYAAAVDSVGIVFFERGGRIVQVLDTVFDRRLARVHRLSYADGVVWALVDEGVARIRFPSRVSHFGSLVPTGLAYAQPIRHDGRLWLLADGIMLRGDYDADRRLTGFVNDTPPGRYVHSISAIAGPLLASNEEGIYRRDPAGWTMVAPGPVNARLNIRSRDGRRWLYVARGEIGWATPTPAGLELRRFPVAALGDNYGVPEDAAGNVWVELGSGRVARIALRGDIPRIEILGPEHGLGSGWVQIYVVDGVARFSVSGKTLRYDDEGRRFVEDTALARRYPEILGAFGRPARDTLGRLWIARQNGVVRIDDLAAADRRLDFPLPAGLQPYLFTMEESGVVWVHEPRRLSRYDPALPEPAVAPPHAVITRVRLTATGRTLYPPAGRLPEPLPYEENSLVVHFLAPGNPFSAPIAFEVQLAAGGEGEWIPTGSTGSASFNRLKEGAYVLRVRPRAGAEIGAEAVLAFTVRPPWFRTPAAYGLYGLAVLTTFLLIAWGSTIVERRGKARLERVVAQRTRELHETNHQLARQVDETLRKAVELQASEDRFRRLNEELERRVDERTAELHGANDRLLASNHELESFSYSVSHDLRAPLRNINGFADLLHRRAEGRLDAECERFLGVIGSEAVRLGQLIDSLLLFSRLGRADLQRVPIHMDALFAEARGELAGEVDGRAVEFRVGPLPQVWADPTLLRQVLVNLLGNALKFTRDRTPVLIEFDTLPRQPDTAEHVFFLRDNGVGFDPKYADKLFGVFQRLHHAKDFTGSGIGLANVRRIVVRHGGRVWADATLGKGATFFFTLPADAPRT